MRVKRPITWKLAAQPTARGCRVRRRGVAEREPGGGEPGEDPGGQRRSARARGPAGGGQRAADAGTYRTVKEGTNECTSYSLQLRLSICFLLRSSMGPGEPVSV